MTAVISIYILFFLSVISSIEKAVIYEFTIEKNKKEFESIMFSSFVAKDDICIGTPSYQCTKIQFDPGASLTFILTHQKNYMQNMLANYSLYDHSKSLTYKSIGDEAKYFSQKMLNGIYSSDKMKFGPFEIEEGFFFLATNIIDELQYSSIGLSYSREGRSTLFLQLMQSDLIDKSIITIEVINDEKGRVTFGEMDNDNHDNQSDKQFNQTYKEEFRMKECDFYVNHYFTVKELLLNDNRVLSKNIKVVFDESFGFIQMPQKMLNKTYSHFLSEMNCEAKTYIPRRRSESNVEYLYYICPKRNIIIINKEKNLTFAFIEANLVLKNKDLFIDYNETSVLFAVLFRIDNEVIQWIIGHPILKNYVIKRNIDNGTFTFYSKYNNDLTETSTSVSTYLCYISSELMLLGFILLFYTYYQYFIKKELVSFQ